MDRTNNIHENGEDRKLKAFAGNKMPYEVPEGYFGELPEKVVQRIRETPVKHVSIRTRAIQLVSVAALLIFAALAAIQFLFNTESDLSSEEALRVEDIYHYSLDNMAELEDHYLVSFLEEDAITLSNLMEDEPDDISDEAIMEYLLAENHTEYYLINEY